MLLSMLEIPRDDLLADAIACVALDVLQCQADSPEARSRFLLDLLALLARYGSGEAAEVLRAEVH
jgi:hypothetical protein